MALRINTIRVLVSSKLMTSSLPVMLSYLVFMQKIYKAIHVTNTNFPEINSYSLKVSRISENLIKE